VILVLQVVCLKAKNDDPSAASSSGRNNKLDNISPGKTFRKNLSCIAMEICSDKQIWGAGR
jgi:hypothetical protein